MVIPANRDSLLRPEGQSNVGRGTGAEPKINASPRDDIPFATCAPDADPSPIAPVLSRRL